MNKENFNEGLLGFLDASPTPFHATKNMAMMLENAGFIRLYEEQSWDLVSGKKYFITRGDSSIIAFNYVGHKHYIMLGSHTDSPNLKLKPNPVIKEHGVVKLSVEPYGGLLYTTWFDRDLSLAGRITYLNSQNIIKDALIDVKKTIAIIPSLAIHLDDKANKEKPINPQTDILPIISSNSDFNLEKFLRAELQKNGIDDIVEVYANELSLYDTQSSSFVGLNNDFIASARLDNLLSCYVGLLSMCSIDDKPMLFFASDHEEIGSSSVVGAEGSFLENTLHRVFKDYEEFVVMTRTSMMISMDNAHAIHPNFPSKHDSNHAPHINKGVVIKTNSNQRYASNSKTVSRFMNVASGIGESYQSFVTRSDMGCGSTIGPIISTKIGIDTIDIGLPTYAMHSIREICGSDDAYSLYKIILGFTHT